MSRTTLLQAGFDAIYYSGLAKLLRGVWGGMGVIFCLHHVAPGGGLQTGFAPNSNLEVTPQFLTDLISLLRLLDYDLISLDEVAERLSSGSGGRRFAVFTLDDGYKDNLEHAMLVFKTANCPFTVYVSPRIADGTCELWWRCLEGIIVKSDHLACRIGTYSFDASTETIAAKHQAWGLLASKLRAMPEYEQRKTIRELADKTRFDIDGYCRSVAMTWDDVRAMARDPLATIGAHTLNHYNLLKLPESDARREIVESGTRIAAEIGKPVLHFAYPYGNRDAAGPREFKICAEAGYKTGVVTRLGTVTSAYRSHLHALPRIMVSGRFQNRRTIETLISGVPGRLANKLKSLNVG